MDFEGLRTGQKKRKTSWIFQERLSDLESSNVIRNKFWIIFQSCLYQTLSYCISNTFWQFRLVSNTLGQFWTILIIKCQFLSISVNVHQSWSFSSHFRSLCVYFGHFRSISKKYVGVQGWKAAHLPTLEIRVEQKRNRVKKERKMGGKNLIIMLPRRGIEPGTCR